MAAGSPCGTHSYQISIKRKRRYTFEREKMNTAKIIITTLVLVTVLGFAGCKKKESPAMPAKETPMKDMQKQAQTTANDTNKTAAATVASIEQTTCPVMEGNKIDKNVFVEYKGKKVYFCCADCKAKFLADPEKYTAKLPQFAK
jgi:YHS domain-containing protein